MKANQEIKEVYVSATGNENWEEDVLGTDTLASGEHVDISFSRRREDMWDIKVVFRNGKSNVWTKLNLSQITDVTLSFKNGKPCNLEERDRETELALGRPRSTFSDLKSQNLKISIQEAQIQRPKTYSLYKIYPAFDI